MLTALLILGFIALIVLIAGMILVAVTVCQALQKQADVLDRAHERWVKHTESLHDRLMSKDWQQYAEIKSFEEEDEGGFFTPEEQEEDDEPSFTLPRLSLRVSAEEERLLAEDFDADGEPIGKVSQ
jgi:predicted transcriptional regulator